LLFTKDFGLSILIHRIPHVFSPFLHRLQRGEASPYPLLIIPNTDTPIELITGVDVER
jgi:hypothetical protein